MNIKKITAKWKCLFCGDVSPLEDFFKLKGSKKSKIDIPIMKNCVSCKSAKLVLDDVEIEDVEIEK